MPFGSPIPTGYDDAAPLVVTRPIVFEGKLVYQRAQLS
jgi:hypothetical protein